jgi:Neuraminyllactose-binding hemagglutinin precursor (NLBH)
MKRGNYRRFFSIILLIGFGVIIVNCAPPPSQLQPTLPPNFSYEPPSTATKALNLTIGIVNPQYKTEFGGNESQSMKNLYSSSMGTDFEKIIIAKGFKTTGPFPSQNEMTYPDKERANLILVPEIAIEIKKVVTAKIMPGGLFLPGKIDGYYSCNGFISLYLIEPLSGEKMWIKKIDLEPSQQEFHVKLFNDLNGNIVKDERDSTDNGEQIIQQLLERSYQEVMTKAWDYLDPTEISNLMPQVDEVRKKAVFHNN